MYAGDPAWVSAHLTVGEGGPGDQHGPQRLATLADVVYSQTAWRDRDCGLVLRDRWAATFGVGPRYGWHHGLTATVGSYFQPRIASTGEAWGPSVGLLGTEGALFLGGTSYHVDVYLHRGPSAPPGKLERITEPARPIAPGPYAERGAEARQCSAPRGL